MRAMTIDRVGGDQCRRQPAPPGWGGVAGWPLAARTRTAVGPDAAFIVRAYGDTSPPTGQP